MPQPKPSLEGRIALHDRQQFEIAWTYPYGQSNYTRYRIDAYFFLPMAIGVSQDTYDPATFFGDTQAYLRLATPKISAKQLLGDHPTAPWRYLEKLLADPSPAMQERAVQRAKLAGCIVRSAIRRQLRKLQDAFRLEDPTAAGELANELIQNIRGLLERVRTTGAKASSPRVVEAFEHIGDALTMASLEATCDALAAVAPRASEPAWAGAVAAVRDFASEQARARKDRGWPSLAPDSGAEQVELFMYRRSQLKKYLFGALFLRVKRLRSRNLVQHIFGATAACLAAIWAFFSNPALFGTVSINGLTFAVLFVAVVAYILKDRMKELTRQYLAGRFRRWLPDRDRRVFPPELIPGTKQHIGRVREYIDFISPEKAGEDVHRLRNAVHTIPLGEDSAESILHYAKLIELWNHPDVRVTTKGIKDILRFNVQHLLTRLDESRDTLSVLDPAAGDTVRLEAEHVYHLNVILRYALIRSDNKLAEPTLERIRIVLNKGGIVRIEPVSLDASQEQIDDEHVGGEAD